MDIFQYLFNRNYKTHNEYLTQLTNIKSEMFGFSRSNDHIEFTDIHVKNNNLLTTTTSSQSSMKFKQSKKYRIYQITPMEELAKQQVPTYSQEELEIIAEMFLVTYTHCTSEEELPNYNKVSQDKYRKEGTFKRFFRRLRRIIA
ncbi:hypothetical protein ACF0H5_005866 [Mactra antiquata]